MVISEESQDTLATIHHFEKIIERSTSPEAAARTIYECVYRPKVARKSIDMWD